MFQSLTTRLARPTTLPDYDRPYGLPAFASVAAALAAYKGDDAVYALFPKVLARAAALFLNGFPGTPMYAVKANPHPAVIRILWSAGIRHFDVASIREIDQVRAVAPDAQLFLMHPVKSRQTIRNAYARGVRHFAFDCADELAKLVEETKGAKDLNLHLRLIVPNTSSAMPLSGKFGADRDTALALLKAARPHARALGVCFHVGSQCMDAGNYATTLAYVRALIDESGVAIDSVDCGGGFPVAYPGMSPAPMQTYFDTISASLKAEGLDNLVIYGEPGRALCAEGGSTLAWVELRKGHDLYLNDGAYGSLFDAVQCSWKYPVKAHRVNADTGDVETLSQSLVPYRFFGPTCDSLDVIEGPFELPADLREGDWIEICHLGAYGQAMTGEFNGFMSEATVAILS